MTSPHSPRAHNNGSVPTVGAIASPMIIGSLVNFFLYGTLLVQAYIYRICFPSDWFGVKLLVYSVVLAMTVCVCLNGVDVHLWYGIYFGQIQGLKDRHFSGIYSAFMSAIIAAIVQFFFCYRIVVIKHAAWPVSILIAAHSILQLIGGTAMGIIPYHSGVHSIKEEVFIRLWLISSPVADILIAITMAYLLLRVEVDPSTRDIVKDVVHIVLETNALSAIVAQVAVGLYFCFDNDYFAAPIFMLPGIYSNTLLATLNHRAVIKLLGYRRNADVAI
ncbi:hypothetical protein C8R47DRAFT_1277432 [Mycena vitilis]|nr:hypothetical protein C8R47DRAFT_1277432 [Mycena vitilis]